MAQKAGQIALRHFREGVLVELKPDESPVTVADREAEQSIRSDIARLFPGESVLGEELGESGTSASRWVIDPIDGTKSFVCGVPLWGTLLAWEENGVPLVGVVCFPALQESVWAETGQGAFWNGNNCHVSSKAEVAGATLCSAGHAGMARAGKSAGLDRLAGRTMATRTWCDAYGHMLVATGRVEAMLDPRLARWDVSAVVPIVKEAGGTCTTFNGTDCTVPTQGQSYELVSSNGLVHDEVLAAFRP